jgi:hypothetical protein
MNAGLAFFLADEAWTASGGSQQGPPRRQSRRAPRRSRVFMLAAALVVIVLGTLGSDAVADPARTGATAQSGDASAGAASAKKKRAAGMKGGRKGAKEKGAKRKRAKKKRRGGRRARDPRPDPLDLYYTAEITGTAENEGPDSSGGWRTASASFRATRASVHLSRRGAGDYNGEQSIGIYTFQIDAVGELFNASATDTVPAISLPDVSCTEQTWTQTEPGPTTIALWASGWLGSTRNDAGVGGKPISLSGATETFSGRTCTTPDGRTTTIEAYTRDINQVGVQLSCVAGAGVTIDVRGSVAWGKASTIAVDCTYRNDWQKVRNQTSLTIAMTPCPGRAARQCAW